MRSLVFLAVCNVQCSGQEALLATPRPDGIDFPTGYEFRIEPSVINARHQFILRYPDGKEDIIWSPINNEYLNHKKLQTKFGAATYAKIVDQTLSLIVSQGDNWWWIRWDMNNKRLFPVVEFPGQRLGMNSWELLDGKSLRVAIPITEMKDMNPTLSIDDKGVLYAEGRPWKEFGYFVFSENWSKRYLQPGLGGVIVYEDNPSGFPYDDDLISKGFMYTLDADGARRPWQEPPTLPDPGAAKRIGRPGHAESSATALQGSNAKASVPAVSGVSESMPSRGSWLVWAWVGIGTITIAVVVCLFLRSRGSKSNEG